MEDGDAADFHELPCRRTSAFVNAAILDGAQARTVSTSIRDADEYISAGRHQNWRFPPSISSAIILEKNYRTVSQYFETEKKCSPQNGMQKGLSPFKRRRPTDQSHESGYPRSTMKGKPAMTEKSGRVVKSAARQHICTPNCHQMVNTPGRGSGVKAKKAAGYSSRKKSKAAETVFPADHRRPRHAEQTRSAGNGHDKQYNSKQFHDFCDK